MCSSHTSPLEERYAKVTQRLNEALVKTNRPSHATQLLAVSKMQSAETIRELYRLGQSAFGEIYLQQAMDKQAELDELDIQWHFIGPIQSNKTREIAQHFDWVHSVDRAKIAQRLNDQRPEGYPPLNICLQVNISAEKSKSGVAPNEISTLAEYISTLPHLRLRGLMTIPAPATTFEEQRQPFARLAHALELLNAEHPDMNLDTLSMGMSEDMEAAIAEGSTMIRIGTALFGPRPPM